MKQGKPAKLPADLGASPIPQLVLHLAIPAMTAQLVNILYNIVDRIYIGNIPIIGGTALAGVGICGPVVSLITSFGTWVGLGGSILFSMRLGAGNRRVARSILATSFYLLALFSAVLTVLVILFKDVLLLFFGASPATFPYANGYMTIYAMGSFFALMAAGLNYFITCQGFALLGMLTVVIGALCNIVLDPIFIFLFDMGVEGAALATVIAQIASSAFAFLVLRGKKLPISLSFLPLRRHLVGKILVLGISPFVILATDSVILILLNAVLQQYGGAEGDLLIAAATIVQSYMLLISSPLLGITSGTQAILSYNYGAGRTERILKAEKCILLLAVSFTALMFVMTQFLPPHFVRLFTTVTEQQTLAIWGIGAFTLAIVPMAFQYTFVDGLTALGCTNVALCLSLLRKCVFALSTLLLPLIFTARHAFYAEAISDGLCATISSAVFLLVIPRYLNRWDGTIHPTLVTPAAATAPATADTTDEMDPVNQAGVSS